MTRSIQFAVAAVGLFASVPAMAQGYNAEIDCGLTWAPGDLVPYTVRLEEQALTVHDLSIVITLSIPGQPDRTVVNAVSVLNPNQDRNVNRSLRLPQTAPAGSYTITLDTDDGVDALFDTCSFSVQ
ncbi:MAG: hypothetical protein ABMB14_18485 [Myxococcota bacterium]